MFFLASRDALFETLGRSEQSLVIEAGSVLGRKWLLDFEVSAALQRRTISSAPSGHCHHCLGPWRFAHNEVLQDICSLGHGKTGKCQEEHWRCPGESGGRLSAPRTACIWSFKSANTVGGLG